MKLWLQIFQVCIRFRFTACLAGLLHLGGDKSAIPRHLPHRVYILQDICAFLDGAVGLISIHLAFYQMNPWLTAPSRIINLWKHTSFERELEFLLFCFRLENLLSSVRCGLISFCYSVRL